MAAAPGRPADPWGRARALQAEAWPEAWRRAGSGSGAVAVAVAVAVTVGYGIRDTVVYGAGCVDVCMYVCMCVILCLYVCMYVCRYVCNIVILCLSLIHI